MVKYLFLLCSFLFFFSTQSLAQVINPEVVRAEAKKRGYENVDEEEVIRRMEARGFDTKNVDPTRIVEYQKALEEIAAELEMEQKEQLEAKADEIGEKAAEEKLEGIAKESAEKIEDAIKDGASVDEAVASEIIDIQNEELPPSRVYGKNLYRNNSIRLFDKNYDVKPTAEYILGVGDIVSIDIWGISEESGTYEVAEEGYIKPSRMPRINLKGVTYAKAKELVRSRFSQYYNFRPEEFELTVSYARSINVNIYGEVLNPGSYTIPALNTGINALVAAGGPSDIGTVRNIRIINSAGQTRTMDLYQFLLDPSVSKDFYLSDDDYIYVDVARKVVEVLGAVNRPMRYELKDGEQLKKLIDYAGGFQDRAYKANLQIKRFENDAEKIIDLDYNALGSRDFKLKAGDVITVNEIPKPFQNFASVSGAVELASKYEIGASTKVRDLIEKALLRRDARRDVAFLLRKNADNTVRTIQLNLAEILENPSSTSNLMIEPEDDVIILSSANYADEAPINIVGAVRNAIEHPYDSGKGLRVSEAITLANGLQKDAADFAYIFRKDNPASNEVEYIRVDLKAAMSNPQSSANIALNSGDQLKVFSKLTFSEDAVVKVAGAVRSPGQYGYDESLKLRDVLSLAGGLQLGASRSRIDVSRVSIDDDQSTATRLITLEIDENLEIVDGNSFQLAPFDQIYVRRAPEFELQRNVNINGEVQFPGQHALIKDNERLLTVIDRAGGLTREAFGGGITLYREKDGVGYVVVDLIEAKKNPNSPFNLILQAGDRIDIPKSQDLVTILGETRMVENTTNEIAATGKISAPYEAGKSANYYIENYVAGVGEFGKKRLVTVEHPNGELQRTKQFLFFNVYPKVKPGSVIKVGKKEKLEKKKTEKKEVDWEQVFAKTITQATAILSLILLIERI